MEDDTLGSKKFVQLSMDANILANFYKFEINERNKL